MKTYMPKPDNIERKWFVVDAKGKTLGRLASQVASILKGKHKPVYSPHMDTGDFVVVINADKVRMTGKRETQKEYFSYSGYLGGTRFRSFAELMEKKPELVIEYAVKGMLPKTKLGKKLNRKLKVYAGESHPHAAQKPEVLSF